MCVSIAIAIAVVVAAFIRSFLFIFYFFFFIIIVCVVFLCCFVDLPFKTEHNDNTHKTFRLMFILEVDERGTQQILILFVLLFTLFWSF